MSTTTSPPLVVVLGATGRSGQVVVDGLIRSGDFRVDVLTRSDSGPMVTELRNRGVGIRTVNIASASLEELKAALVNVDFLVSCMSASALEAQLPVFDAAKAVGVRRIIPSDFGTSAPPATFVLHDRKLAVREYVRGLGVPYTFVEIGWWMQLALPYPSELKDQGIAPLLDLVYGGGVKKNALTDLTRVGGLVPRILKDERTINQLVFLHHEEASTQDVWDIAQRVSGLGEELLSRQIHVSEDEHRAKIEHARLVYQQEQTFANAVNLTMLQYAYSMHVRGDNTLENATRLGALNARQLYPDLEVQTLEDYATAFYRSPSAIAY